MPEAAALVTSVLLLAVARCRLGVILPVLLLIVGMLLPPLLLAFPHPGDTRGPSPASCGDNPRDADVTIRLTANPLLGTVSGRQKRTLAVWTTAGVAQVDSSGFEGEISEENQNHGEDAREMKPDITRCRGRSPRHGESSW
jgi:hypothetical protein